MSVNKVIYGTTVLVDLTEDTVTADKLLHGATAHGADGTLIEGTARILDTNDATTAASDICAGLAAYAKGEKNKRRTRKICIFRWHWRSLGKPLPRRQRS